MSEEITIRKLEEDLHYWQHGANELLVTVDLAEGKLKQSENKYADVKSINEGYLGCQHCGSNDISKVVVDHTANFDCKTCGRSVGVSDLRFIRRVEDEARMDWLEKHYTRFEEHESGRMFYGYQFIGRFDGEPKSFRQFVTALMEQEKKQ